MMFQVCIVLIVLQHFLLGYRIFNDLIFMRVVGVVIIFFCWNWKGVIL